MQRQENPRPGPARMLKVGFAAAGAAVVALLFWKPLLEIIRILFGAGLIAFLLSPLYSLLERYFRRPIAAFCSLLLAAGLLLGTAVLLLPALVRQLMQLADLLPEAFLRICSAAEGLADHLERRVPGLTLPTVDLSGLSGHIGALARSAAATMGGMAGGLYRLFLMSALSFFLISDRDSILLRLELLAPLRWRRQAVISAAVLARQLRMYLRGQLTIALAVGAVAALALFLLRLQGALLLGLMVGACNIIPYIGPFLGGIPAVAAALGLSWQRALLTVLALFLVQQIDGLLISPRVMGGITGFSPAVVLVTVFAGARIGGIGGMLLAMPLLMAGRTIYRVFVQRCEKN